MSFTDAPSDQEETNVTCKANKQILVNQTHGLIQDLLVPVVTSLG